MFEDKKYELKKNVEISGTCRTCGQVVKVLRNIEPDGSYCEVLSRNHRNCPRGSPSFNHALCRKLKPKEIPEEFK